MISQRELEQRSYLKISYRFYRDPVKEVLHTIFHRDLYKGNLQNLPWYLFVILCHVPCNNVWGLLPG